MLWKHSGTVVFNVNDQVANEKYDRYSGLFNNILGKAKLGRGEHMICDFKVGNNSFTLWHDRLTAPHIASGIITYTLASTGDEHPYNLLFIEKNVRSNEIGSFDGVDMSNGELTVDVSYVVHDNMVSNPNAEFSELSVVMALKGLREISITSTHETGNA